jgi:hypothetical protein
MGAFSGQLRSNEIFSALYNMIISQEVFADNLGEHQTLVDKARVDGSLYGDTKLYYATDVLKSAPWGNDAEATNLLALHRPEAPECQAIHLDIFRQICLTVDNYLSKRAWATEGAFSSFNSVMLGWMRETKRVYDGTLYNVFIGTEKSAETKQNVEIDIAGARGNASTELEADKLEAFAIAQALADLLIEMGDYSRDFNDYHNLRSYAKEGIKVIWNAKFVNKIRKVDLPTIFHKDGLVDKFEEEVLPARYFGEKNSAKVVAGSNDGSYRSVLEKDYTVDTVVTHVFPGDKIPAGAEIAAGEGYLEDDKVICKVLVKLPPYMSAFEVGTSFFNAKSLTENHYLTFGHNTIEYLKNYPFITVKAKAE